MNQEEWWNDNGEGWREEQETQIARSVEQKLCAWVRWADPALALWDEQKAEQLKGRILKAIADQESS